MKLKNKFFICIITLFFLQLPGLVYGLDIYVSPNGNDNNDGTEESPIKTLEAAKNRVRSQKGSESVTVYFRAGTYPVTKEVVFTNSDSGTASAPIKYTSYPGETAFFDGLKKVDSSKFTKVTGNLANLLHNNAKGKVWSQVITDPELIKLLEDPDAGLSFNNKMLVTTASPNSGFYHRSTVYSKGEGQGSYDNPKGETFSIFEDIDFGKLSRELARGGKQGYLQGYLSAAWYNERAPIQRLGGTGSKVFVLVNKTRYGIAHESVSRFRIKNMLTTLDIEREWFFDKLDNRLYIMPPQNTINATDVIGIWAGPQVIRVQGASHLSFEKFVFQHLGKGPNGHGAITAAAGENIRIAGCTFRYISGLLTAINFVGVTNSLVTSSDFYDNVRGSRLYGGSYDQNSITHGRNVFENNHFTQVDSRDFYGAVAGLNGAGNVFRNNLVHNSNGQPITHAGVDHKIEFNEIFNVGIEEGDGGAVYTGANLFSFGNLVQYNFVHHLISTPGITERAGFFSDDYDAGETYRYNTLYKAANQSIKMNAGSGHTVIGNVIMNTRNAVDLLGRPETYERNFNIAANLLRTDPNSRSKSNYIGRAEKVLGDFANNETATYNPSWTGSFWAKRYPFLFYMLSNSNGKLGMNAQQIRVYDNLFYQNSKNFNHSEGYGAERGSIELDINQFENPSTLNFRFITPRPQGYPDTKFEQIGLKIDQYRNSVPSKNAYRTAVKDRWQSEPAYLNQRYDRNTIKRRVYYNTGKLIIADTQKGLGVNEGDATKGVPGPPLPIPTPTPIPNSTNQSPYASHGIPGKIQAENYDKGGQGVAYNDVDNGNNGKAYRQDNVDIQAANDDGGGYLIGWIASGEWVEYTLSNVVSGLYDIRLRVAAAGVAEKAMQLELNGDSLGTVKFNATNGWQEWETVTLFNVFINGDNNNILRLNFLSSGFNLNWIEFVTETPVPVLTPPVPNNTPTPSSAPAPKGDQCDTTFECKATYGSSATDCMNSWSDSSVCMCGSLPCE